MSVEAELRGQLIPSTIASAEPGPRAAVLREDDVAALDVGRDVVGRQSSSTSARRSAIATLFRAPRLMPRSRATYLTGDCASGVATAGDVRRRGSIG